MNSSKGPTSRQKSSNVKSSNPSIPDSVYSNSYKYKKGNQNSSRKRVASKSSQNKKEVKKGAKAPAQKKRSVSSKKAKASSEFKTSEKDLREICELYFDYIIENLQGKANKIFNISFGKIIKKQTFEN
jgi:hypothetical protein